MTVPPPDEGREPGPGAQPRDAPLWPPPPDDSAAGQPAFDPYRFGKPDEPAAGPPAFDPYRFGKPDRPVPPEYAPPGYRPPGGMGAPGFPPVPPPPPGYPYGVVRQGNTRATISLVLGILSLVFFWLTLLDLVLIIPAIVLGAVALNDARRDPARGGRGMAKAGLICGIVATLLAVVAAVVVYQRIKPCIQDYDVNSQPYKTCIQDKLVGERP